MPVAASSPVAAAAASAASAVAAPPVLAFDAQVAFEQWPRLERDAWGQLAQRWGVALDAADQDPCSSAAAQALGCSRMTTTLAVIRQLDRPGIVTLRQGSGKPAYAVLQALDDDSATLQVGAQAMRLPLGQLATLWNGEFATLWRMPADYRKPFALGEVGPVVDGLARQLAAWADAPAPTAGRAYDAALKTRVSAFQRAQGLMPDGIAGPTTFMQLNRVSGVEEPRLSSGRQTH